MNLLRCLEKLKGKITIRILKKNKENTISIKTIFSYWISDLSLGNHFNLFFFYIFLNSFKL